MLETIKQTINNLPNLTFDEFYLLYIIEVQDKNLQLEATNAFKQSWTSGLSSVGKIDGLIQTTYERLVK